MQYKPIRKLYITLTLSQDINNIQGCKRRWGKGRVPSRLWSGGLLVVWIWYSPLSKFLPQFTIVILLFVLLVWLICNSCVFGSFRLCLILDIAARELTIPSQTPFRGTALRHGRKTNWCKRRENKIKSERRKKGERRREEKGHGEIR